MGCGCSSNPCCCQQADPCFNVCDDEPVNKDPYGTSVANLDRTCNMFWREGQNGFAGSSPLDLMTYGQVAYILRRNPRAKADLLRITDDPCLVALANSVALSIPDDVENQTAVDRLQANSLPFYAVFKGNPSGTLG